MLIENKNYYGSGIYSIRSSLTTSIPNDEISCELCPRGKSSAAGSTSCDLTTVKLPNGNGEHEAAKRVGNTLGRIVDDILVIKK